MKYINFCLFFFQAYSKTKPAETEFSWIKKVMDESKYFEPSAGDSADAPSPVRF